MGLALGSLCQGLLSCPPVAGFAASIPVENHGECRVPMAIRLKASHGFGQVARVEEERPAALGDWSFWISGIL